MPVLQGQPCSARMRRAAMAIAIAFAVGISGFIALSSVRAFDQANRAVRALDRLVFAHNLLDDLNHERSEAIYLAASGQADKSNYLERAEHTEATLGNLRAALLPEGEEGPLAVRNEAVVQHALDALAGLAEVRAAIRAERLTPVGAAQAYNAIIDTVIDDAGRIIASLAPDRPNHGPAFVALARIDDQAGLETGVGFVGFALGALPGELHPLFASAIEAQGAARVRFHALATEAQTRALDRAYGEANTARLGEARHALHLSASGAPLDPVHRAAWAEAMLARETDLSVLRNLFVRQALEDLAADRNAEARGALIRGGLGLLALLGALGLVLKALSGAAAARPPMSRAPA